MAAAASFALGGSSSKAERIGRRCMDSPWERARTTPERRDMGHTLESETGPRQGPYCIGVGRAPGPLSLCYVMLYPQKATPCTADAASSAHRGGCGRRGMGRNLESVLAPASMNQRHIAAYRRPRRRPRRSSSAAQAHSRRERSAWLRGQRHATHANCAGAATSAPLSRIAVRAELEDSETSMRSAYVVHGYM